jgi:hypothetical protein
MRSQYLLAAGTVAWSGNAHAHGFAGDHRFISILLIDDPSGAAVGNDPSSPTIRQQADRAQYRGDRPVPPVLR